MHLLSDNWKSSCMNCSEDYNVLGKAKWNRSKRLATAGLVVTIYSQQSKSGSRRRTEKPHGKTEKVVVMIFCQYVNGDAHASTKPSMSRSRIQAVDIWNHYELAVDLHCHLYTLEEISDLVESKQGITVPADASKVVVLGCFVCDKGQEIWQPRQKSFSRMESLCNLYSPSFLQQSKLDTLPWMTSGRARIGPPGGSFQCQHTYHSTEQQQQQWQPVIDWSDNDDIRSEFLWSKYAGKS